MEIRIYTDSAADMTEEEKQKYGVSEIAIPVNFDGVEEKNLPLATFWEKLLAGEKAGTSQPSQHLFEKAFTKAKEENYAVVCVLISSKLSGTYESACAVKEKLGYENIFVVDSLTASMAEKQIVFEAVRLKESGLSAKEVAERLNEFKSRVRLYACIDTLKFLARSGRISKVAAEVGGLINLKPLITLTQSGEVKMIGKALGNRIATKKLIDKLAEDEVASGYSVMPIFSHTEENLLMLMQSAQKRHLTGFSESMQIGPTIGTHIGPGGFGFAYVVKE